MLYRGPYPTAFYRRLHSIVHKEHLLHQAAGTVSPAVHLRNLVRRGNRRRALARARDAVTLPVDRVLLRGMAFLEEARRGGRTGGALPAIGSEAAHPLPMVVGSISSAPTPLGRDAIVDIVATGKRP